MSTHLLHKKALALVNFKGGSGKSLLTANLAAIATRKMNWRVVVVDLDSSAPLTQLALRACKGIPTIKQALEQVVRGASAAEFLQFTGRIGCWLLPGSIQQLSQQHIHTLPQLILDLKNTYFDGGYVDLVIVDAPGENKLTNSAVLAGVDLVAMPLALASTDMASTGITLGYIKQMQARRNGDPGFLGLIPNRVVRKGSYERSFLDLVLGSGTVLPYIPESNTIKASFLRTKDDARMPIHFAPKAKATQRLIMLFDALNSDTSRSEESAVELGAYLGEETAVGRSSKEKQEKQVEAAR